MAVGGWLLDKSAVDYGRRDAGVSGQLADLSASLRLCRVGQLELLWSARSADDYDHLAAAIDDTYDVVEPPPDVWSQAVELHRDLAHHHEMWHRTPLRELLIAVTALHHGLGVVHVDGDYDRIALMRPLEVRRLTPSSG